jgi:hypothetical protein
MEHFFSLKSYNENLNEKINLDELYERKKQIDEHHLNVYKKILNRVHNKIKLTSRQRHNEQFIFFVVPEFIFGIPRYDINTCITFLIDKLNENGFLVKYTHPNLLFISWKHYIPYYKRIQIKRETGYDVDCYGNIIEQKPKKNMMDFITKTDKKENENEIEIKEIKKEKDYKDISTYKPTGIYNNDLLKNLKDKLS